MQRMRILLQQKDHGLFFKDIDSWTPEPSEAMDFVSSTAAIEFCSLNKLASVQVVLKFEEEKLEIVLPDIAPNALRANRPRPAV